MDIKLFKILLILVFVSSNIIVGCGSSIGSYHAPVEQRSIKTSLNDSAIYTKVKTGISRNKFVDARLIVVDVFNGVVTLTGTVKTQSMRITAGDTARRVRNVLAVKNYIEIKY